MVVGQQSPCLYHDQRVFSSSGFPSFSPFLLEWAAEKLTFHNPETEAGDWSVDLTTASSEFELIGLVSMQYNSIWIVLPENKYSFSDVWMHWHWRLKEMESRYNIFIYNFNRYMELDLIRKVTVLQSHFLDEFFLSSLLKAYHNQFSEMIFLDCISVTQFKAFHQFSLIIYTFILQFELQMANYL